jgi:CubicO group peptidase (beta-lactamase class C family)
MEPRTLFKRTPLLVAVFIMCTGLILPQGITHSQSTNENTLAELDTFFKNILSTQHYVGLGACLVKNDKVVWEGYYGYANLEEKTPLNRESIFPLMSLSKTVTAFALMMLHEEGLFALDDDVNKYLPIKVRNPNFPETPITFRMLLNHTASFQDVTPTGLTVPKNVSRPPSALGDSKIPLEEYIREILTPGGKYYAPEYFSGNEPGTRYSYSNIGYSLLGYLVEKIAREDFGEYCKRRILVPLEMNDTGWHLRDLDTGRVIFGYSFSPNDSVPSYRKVPHFGEPGYPAGMLRTTMDDFARFIGVIVNNGRYRYRQLLKPQTIELMLRPQNIKNIPSRAFKIVDRSLAWLINEVEGSELYTMNGFSPSMFTNAYFSATERIVIIYYYTGLNMKNMAAMPEITRKLYHALKAMN